MTSTNVLSKYVSHIYEYKPAQHYSPCKANEIAPPPMQKLLIINIKDCQTRLLAYYSLLFLPYLLNSRIDLHSHGSFASFSHTKNWNVHRRPLHIISILDVLSHFGIQNVLATNYTSCSHAHAILHTCGRK